jgi:hypothetical protein
VASQKTEIIERLFDQRWDSVTETLSDPIVTLRDVQNAIREHNAAHPTLKRPLSDRNPANFSKDIFRKRASANRIWPRSVFERGYTGRQVTGGGACFEFVSIALDQTVPFPTEEWSRELPHYRIESASLPLASRRLGRTDEPWLVQVLVRLRVIETHLALVSDRNVVQVDHLQMSVKHRKTEIDALFLAVEMVNGETRDFMICCEAKGLQDDIIEEQVVNQVRTVFHLQGVPQDIVLPLVVKVVAPSQVLVREYNVLTRDQADTFASLTVACEAIYELVPPVPGIGGRQSRRVAKRD